MSPPLLESPPHARLRAAPPPAMPPLPAIVVPVMIGTWLTALGVVDLAVDLSRDPTLFSAWYGALSADTLPIISTFFKLILPPLAIILLLKCTFISLPAARAGRRGAIFGCAPFLLLPLIIFTSVKSKSITEAAPFQNTRGHYILPPDDDLALVTTLHQIRTCLGPLMIACAVAEYAAQARAATKAKSA